MRIGFDLDGIFIGTPPLVSRKLLEKFYKAKDNGELVYRIPSYPEQLFRKATHLPMLRPPIEENVKLLKSLPKKSHKFYLISSRYKFLEKETTSFLKRHRLDKLFDEVHINHENRQAHSFKNEMVKKLKLDILIDDDLSLLKFVAKENPTTKFFWLNAFKENKKHNVKNIVMVRNLEEIFK